MTVPQAEQMRQQLQSDLTRLVMEFEARTGLWVTSIDAGHFVDYMETPVRRVRAKGVNVEVRL
jgi:hypothetical protein